MMRGLTLVEMIIALGISTLIAGLLVVIVINSSGLFYKQSSKLQTGINVNDVLSKVRSAVLEASSVDPASSAVLLSLKVPSKDALGNVIANTFDSFIFSKDGTYLHFQTIPNQASSRAPSDQVLTSVLENLQFKYFDLATPPNEVLPADAKKVNISLTLKQKSGAGYEINTQDTEANLRND